MYKNNHRTTQGFILINYKLDNPIIDMLNANTRQLINQNKNFRLAPEIIDPSANKVDFNKFFTSQKNVNMSTEIKNNLNVESYSEYSPLKSYPNNQNQRYEIYGNSSHQFNFPLNANNYNENTNFYPPYFNNQLFPFTQIHPNYAYAYSNLYPNNNQLQALIEQFNRNNYLLEENLKQMELNKTKENDFKTEENKKKKLKTDHDHNDFYTKVLDHLVAEINDLKNFAKEEIDQIEENQNSKIKNIKNSLIQFRCDIEQELSKNFFFIIIKNKGNEKIKMKDFGKQVVDSKQTIETKLDLLGKTSNETLLNDNIKDLLNWLVSQESSKQFSNTVKTTQKNPKVEIKQVINCTHCNDDVKREDYNEHFFYCKKYLTKEEKKALVKNKALDKIIEKEEIERKKKKK